MSYASIACADPAYATALEAKGFTTRDTVQYGGKEYGHHEIAEVFDAAYQRHRGENVVVCGGKPRLERKRQRQFDKAVKSDVYTSFGISWWTVLFGGILVALGGPMGLVIAVVACMFEYYLNRDLEGDKTMHAVMGVA